MSESILVIEDDHNLRELLVESLEDAGYKVEAAGDPDKAMALASRRGFDLAISDVRMAGSTDGIGALEAIKKLQPRIRTIVMTGFASLEAPVRAARIAADDYLLKGDSQFGVAELLRVVRSVLERDEVTPLTWWQKLLAWPGKLAQAPDQAALAAKLPALEAQRKSLFSALFLLIRSAHLSKDDFWDFWRCLLPIERDYLALSKADAVFALEERYARLGEGLLVRKTSRERPDALGLHCGQVGELFERVRQGLVEAWQFEQASTLWISPRERRESPHSYILFCLLWGPRCTLEPDYFVGKTLGVSTRVLIQKRLTSIGDVQRYQGLLQGPPPGAQCSVEMVSQSPEALDFVGRLQGDPEILDVEVLDPYVLVIRRPSEMAGKLEYQLKGQAASCRRCQDILASVFEQVMVGHSQGIYDGCLGPHRIYTTTFGGRLDCLGPSRFRNLMSAEPSLNLLCFGEMAHLSPEVRSVSPHQADGERVLTAQADQYCLGSLYTQVLLGLPSRQFLGLLLEAPKTPLGAPDFKLRLRQPAWEQVEPILHRMMAYDPARRFATLSQAYWALKEAIRGVLA